MGLMGVLMSTPDRHRTLEALPTGDLSAWRMRVGKRVPRNLYLHPVDSLDGVDVGRMDTAELAALVVEAVNHFLAAARTIQWGVRLRWADGREETLWRGSRAAAEQWIDGVEIEQPPASRELVWRHVLVGPVRTGEPEPDVG